MKRVLEIELLNEEMVTEANTKDKEGRWIYPLVVTFFQASGGLMEVLMNRPLAFLNLLQTNQALALFWREFAPNIWILLLERFIENELGAYMVDVYPFFEIQHHRTYGREKAESLSLYKPYLIEHDIELGVPSNDPLTRYYVIYYDRITELFIDLLRRLITHEVPDVISPIEVIVVLTRYLNLQINSNRYVACLSDCFVVEDADIVFNFQMSWISRTVLQINKAESITTGYTLVLAELLDTLVFNKDPVVHAKPLLLDSETTKPYRDLLYDKKTGLYNTPEEQRAFFLSSLRNRGLSKEVMIEKYGSAHY